ALELGQNAVLVPGTRVREERKTDAPRAAALGRRDCDLGSGGVVAVAMRAAADQPDRSKQGQRELPAAVDELVLHDVVEQDGDSIRVHEPVRREGRERHLAVAALGLEASLADRERALSGSWRC